MNRLHVTWQIHEQSNYCKHETGLTALFDPQLTQSGAIRCIGPYGCGQLRSEQVLSLVKDLTLEIEKLFKADNAYVVWGSQADEIEYAELSIEIYGNSFGYLPWIWARSELFEYGHDLSFEWSDFDTNLVHRSGLNLINPSLSRLDPALFHPVFMDDAITRLAENCVEKFNTESCVSNVVPFLPWRKVRHVNGTADKSWDTSYL